MFNPNQKKAHQTLRIFGLTWLIVTLLLIFLGVSLERNHFDVGDKDKLDNTAEKIIDKIDTTIENIEQSIYKLEINKTTVEPCQESLQHGLEQLLFNYPMISGIFITDSSNRLLCTTLHFDTQILGALDQQHTFVGPIGVSNQNKPAYILQLQDGNYGVNLFILQSVLEPMLASDEPIVTKIMLVEKKTNNILLQLTRQSPTGAFTITPQNQLQPTVDTSNTLTVSSTLRNIPNMRLVLSSSSNSVQYTHYLFEMLGILASLLFSWFVYTFIKRRISARHSDEKYLHYAFKNHKFFPVYLPTFSLKANKFVGSEVLIRLKTETENVVTPNFFVPMLEKTGLIVPVTLQLIDTALKECRPLLDDHSQHLAFNLSASHFSHNTFVAEVTALLEKHQVPAKQILFEVTEREILDIHDDKYLEGMKQLRTIGCSLAIDDFGTGHASINYLRHFPFTHLKIDQIFVQSIGTGAVTESLNNSIILLAKELKLKIIAEGVETAEQFEYLKSHHVDYYQGWYFSKAKPFDKFKEQ